MVSDLVSKNIIKFSMKKNRFKKIQFDSILQKVLDSNLFRFWVSSHTASNAGTKIELQTERFRLEPSARLMVP